MRIIGRGGSGEVWEARRQSTGQRVAVKVLLGDGDPNGVFAERFRREARSISQLSHPNTVRLYGFGAQDDGQLFMVLEYIEGETLRTRLQQAPMSTDEVRHVGVEVLRSLAQAHALGIIHRDIKPANIMLQATGDDQPAVRLLDFSIAHVKASQLTDRSVAVGTTSYMSPEMWLGHAFDGRADLYSLGVTLWECLVGRPPFQGLPHLVAMDHVAKPPPPLVQHARVPVSSAMAAVIETALAKEPSERFDDAATMRSALYWAR